MKKRELGLMHWFFALLLWVLAYFATNLVSNILWQIVLPPVLVGMSASFILGLHIILYILLCRVRDCVWYMLTFRRYCTALPYFIIGIVHIILIAGNSLYVEAYLNSKLSTGAVLLYTAIDCGISIQTFVYFINHPGKEAALEEAAQAPVSEPSDTQ